MSNSKEKKDESREQEKPTQEQPSREPFPPDHTPDPPQIMNPSSDHERNQKGTKELAQQESEKEKKAATHADNKHA